MPAESPEEPMVEHTLPGARLIDGRAAAYLAAAAALGRPLTPEEHKVVAITADTLTTWIEADTLRLSVCGECYTPLTYQTDRIGSCTIHGAAADLPVFRTGVPLRLAVIFPPTRE